MNDECNIKIDFDRHLSELIDVWKKKNTNDRKKLVLYYGDIIKTNEGYFVVGDNEPNGMIAGKFALHKIKDDEIEDYLKNTGGNIIELNRIRL